MATTTWTQTAGMTSDEDVDNVDSFAEQAEASKDAAAASATAAAASESAASASASSASASATTATTKAAEASTSATNAATSASSASSSATSATASETAAATSKNAAAASATAAAASETAAAASETAAASSETNAATSETNAATSATSASTSATTASTAATTASTAATNAATSETNAATSASTASTAATNAATSETNAATSETNAATSATNAATSETNAATSATSASTSASAASTSATAAAASQSAAAASAASAASAYDTFDDRYLGSKTADPTVDNDGDALVSGALYFNSTANEMRVYDGANWIAATSAGNVSLLEYKYTATSGQTTFSGADDSSNTLSYTQDNLIVTLNGVVLENGTDYTATTGTSVVLASGAATSDELNVIAFKSFTTADMVSATNGGTFYNNIDVQGTVTADGLTVESSNLQVKLSEADGTYNPRLITYFDSAGTHIQHTWSSAAANLIFEVGGAEGSGTERMRIDSSGNVGIGTSSPSGKLTLKAGDNTYAGGFRLEGTDETTALAITHVNGDNYFSGNATDDHLVLTGSGNVGIGTTSPSSFNTTGGKLVVASGAGNVAALFSDAAYYTLGVKHTGVGTEAFGMFGGTAGSGLALMTNNTERMRIDGSNGNLLFNGSGVISVQSSSDSLYLGGGTNQPLYNWIESGSITAFKVGGSERMRIDSSGNVGIGTSSPVASLDVIANSGAGCLSLRTRVNNDYSFLTFRSNDGTEDLGGSAIYRSAASTSNLLFYTANGGAAAERMRIDSSGKLLVGTTSSNSTGLIQGRHNTGAGNAVLTTWNEANSGTRFHMQFLDSSSGSDRGSITTNGSSTSFNTTSDYRLKENVTDVTDGITRVKQLAPKRFNFIADPDTTVDGFIAHEVQDVIPEAISGAKDAMRDEEYEVTPEVLDDDGNVVTEAVMGTRSVPDYQGIDQSKLVPLLTAALQEAIAKIETLETEMTSVKARLDALEAN